MAASKTSLTPSGQTMHERIFSLAYKKISLANISFVLANENSPPCTITATLDRKECIQ